MKQRRTDMAPLHVDVRHRHPGGFEVSAELTADGGVTALFGPSGSGKTTLLSLIAGIQRPDSGSIRMGDRVLFDSIARVDVPPEERGMGVVFQDALLFPHRSVEENLRYGMRRRPRGPVEFQEVARVLELGTLLDRPPATLSGGEKQRVAVGRALLSAPRLLLLDEPFTGVHAALKHRMIDHLEAALRRWMVPALFVSHDQADVRRLADHVVVLEGGRVVGAGATAETLDRAVTTGMKAQLGPVNLLRVDSVEAKVERLEGVVGGERVQLPVDLPHWGGAAWVQFLPRDVVLSRGDVEGLSVRNHLHGRVVEIVALPDRAFVAVDVGQRIWAEVTLDAVRELRLEAGAAVTCFIKTTALHGLD